MPLQAVKSAERSNTLVNDAALLIFQKRDQIHVLFRRPLTHDFTGFRIEKLVDELTALFFTINLKPGPQAGVDALTHGLNALKVSGFLHDSRAFFSDGLVGFFTADLTAFRHAGDGFLGLIGFRGDALGVCNRYDVADVHILFVDALAASAPPTFSLALSVMVIWENWPGRNPT
ncbi:hypothetical protein [Oceanicaulis sp. UBA2681]|uniref:hypothetical protein n=1 Tax=Oceanicaulis sp. UBA2681 TaxID=1947007 RepID=UPI00257E0498|nr:hypothetical protein [Oceanicaulis sp. UBA2681]